MSAYYNEIEPFAAQWIRNLISAGLVAPGDVDERSIEDVRPDDIRGYTQCHFFAGIAVWSHALRRAGWPDDRPVWTGSCPCQPFSAAGKGGGFADERHLWPTWLHLIGELRPPVIFGEQISAKDGLMWLDLVQAGLEDADYACGPLDICAAGVGAPHIRQRLFFVAERLGHHHHQRLEGRRGDGLGRADQRAVGSHGVVGDLAVSGLEDQSRWGIQRLGEGDRTSGGAARERPAGLRASGDVAVSDHAEWGSDRAGGNLGDGHDARREESSGDAEGCRGASRLDDPAGSRRVGPLEQSESDPRDQARERLSGAGRETGVVANTRCERSAERGDVGDVGDETATDQSESQERKRVRNTSDDRSSICGPVHGTSPTDGFWRDVDWVLCRDPDGPRWRPVRPSSFVLVDEYPARVGKLRAYGNAITAEVATTFVSVYLEHESEKRIEDLI